MTFFRHRPTSEESLSEQDAGDFGYLGPDTHYFDSACQTLRPQPVIAAVTEYYRQYNACGGRVKYAWGEKVDGIVADTLNGSEGSAVYRLHEPNTILLGKTGQDLAPVPVPAEFLKPAGSPRNLDEGAPATVFRYDLMWEFISAISQGRPAVPSFYDGWNAQIVADAVLQSHSQRRWIDTALGNA